MATVLDVISGGRMVVGLGTGSHVGEHEAYGVPFEPPARRTRRALDTLAVMRAMFQRPEGATLDGLLRDAPNLPAPVRPGGPPIWLAAHGPRLLRAAGDLADGIVAAFVPPEEVARRLAIARAARDEDLWGPLACALYTYVLPMPSPAEAHGWLEPEARGACPARGARGRGRHRRHPRAAVTRSGGGARCPGRDGPDRSGAHGGGAGASRRGP